MACDAATLILRNYAEDLPGLSERDVMNCLGAVFSQALSLSAQHALNMAKANGYAGLSTRQLWEILLFIFCNQSGLSGMFLLDDQGNFILDDQGNKIIISL